MKHTYYSLLFLLALFCCGSPATVMAQSNDAAMTDIKSDEISNKVAKYYGIGIGLNRLVYRDFATSPLFFNGAQLQVALSRLKASDQRETEYEASYGFGLSISSSENNRTSSKTNRLGFTYSQLFRTRFFEKENLHAKVGFLLAGNATFRLNQSLNNNAVGLDMFANAMGSIKLIKTFHRKSAKDNMQRKRHLAFRLNLGIINSSYRNGYVYADQSALLNDPDIFGGYKFKVFSGYRVSSRLDYTRHLKNNNAIQLSYIWDAYATGGDLDKLQMADHLLKFTLFFNTHNQ